MILLEACYQLVMFSTKGLIFFGHFQFSFSPSGHHSHLLSCKTLHIFILFQPSSMSGEWCWHSLQSQCLNILLIHYTLISVVGFYFHDIWFLKFNMTTSFKKKLLFWIKIYCWTNSIYSHLNNTSTSQTFTLILQP